MSARIPSSRGPGQLNKDKVKILCQEIDKVNLFSQTPKTVTIEVGRTGFEVYKPRDSVWDSRTSKDQQQQQHRKSSAFHPAPPVHHHHRDTKRRIPVEAENYEVTRTISSIVPKTGEVVRKLDKYTSTDNGVVLTGKNKASQTEDVLLAENGTDPYAILDF
ncbi:hypothetical protein M8J76_015449 [Diaphorina citri]|nr:hypothetical protein M8J75_004192 [Diaphorina citri]KAI5714338.1 hypothetical protein M8J76_015449 [Diaphorina citri]